MATSTLSSARKTHNVSVDISELKRRECEQARPVLERLWGASFAKRWEGRAGLTAWSAYQAALWHAWRHGRLTVPEEKPHAGERVQDGVFISLSMRQWAELTGCGLEAINNARKTLEQMQLVRRDGPRLNGTQAGAFVLSVAHLGPRRTETLEEKANQKGGVSRVAKECFGLARVAMRWSAPGQRRLGKTKEALFHALLFLGGSAELWEICAAVQRDRARDMRRHLDELVAERIIGRSGDRYFLRHEESQIELAMTQQFNGEAQSAQRQQEQFERERKAFARTWDSGEVLSHRERQKRAKWLLRKDELEAQRERARADAQRLRARAKRARFREEAIGTTGELEKISDHNLDEADNLVEVVNQPEDHSVASDGDQGGSDRGDGDHSPPCLAAVPTGLELPQNDACYQGPTLEPIGPGATPSESEPEPDELSPLAAAERHVLSELSDGRLMSLSCPAWMRSDGLLERARARNIPDAAVYAAGRALGVEQYREVDGVISWRLRRDRYN